MRVLLLVLVVASVLCGSEAQSPPEIEAELWTIVPASWRPLPASSADPAQDPSELIIAAGKAVVSPSPLDDETLWRSFMDATTWRKAWPTGAAADALQAWLDAPERRDATTLLERAMALGARCPLPANATDPVTSPGGDLMRFLAVTARRAVEAGDFAAAEADLRRMAGLYRIIRGDSGPMGLIVDLSRAQSVVNSAIGIAVRMPPDRASIARLRALVPLTESPPGEAMPRVLLSSLIPALAKASEEGDRWVQDLQGMHLKAALLREQMRETTGSTTPASERSGIFALAGLPHALDRRATVELAVQLLTSIQASQGKDAWMRGPVHDLIEETGHAGDVLDPTHDLVQDLTATLGKAGNQASDPEPWRQANVDFRRMAGQPNPLGRIMVSIHLSTLPFLLDSVRVVVARSRMTQLALTLLDHRVQYGMLPDVLPADAPVDPFTETAFHWDPVRQLLWSVGRNGVDDAGDRRKDEAVSLSALPQP